MKGRLRQLIGRHEGEAVEYKQRISSANKIAKTLCAFANGAGGHVLIGINDKGQVTGIDPEEEKYMINKAATFFCRPVVPVQYEIIEEEEDEEILVVLVVKVPESPEKPHYAQTKPDQWHAYIRRRDESLPASEMSEKLMRSGQWPAEAATHDYTPADKQEARLFAYLDKHDRITLKEFMQTANLSKRRAARILTELVRRGVLREFDHQKEPYYST